MLRDELKYDIVDADVMAIVARFKSLSDAKGAIETFKQVSQTSYTSRKMVPSNFGPRGNYFLTLLQLLVFMYPTLAT